LLAEQQVWVDEPRLLFVQLLVWPVALGSLKIWTAEQQVWLAEQRVWIF
jgi:hypothetical protein